MAVCWSTFHVPVRPQRLLAAVSLVLTFSAVTVQAASPAADNQQMILQVYQPVHLPAGDIEELFKVMTKPFRTYAQPYAIQRFQNWLEDLYVAGDNHSGVVFVRGSTEDVARAEQLIKAVDVPAGKLRRQTFDGLCIVPVPDSRAHLVAGILEKLQLPCHRLALGKAQVLILPADNPVQLAQSLDIIATVAGASGAEGSDGGVASGAQAQAGSTQQDGQDAARAAGDRRPEVGQLSQTAAP